jgi:predicted neuraminidase
MEFMKRFVHHPDTDLPQCHAATIAQLEEGTLVCAWYAGAYEKARDVAVYGATLSPGAARWSDRRLFADTPDFSEGNPLLFRDASDRLWLFYVTMMGDRWDTCQVKYCHSLDGGRTWGESIFLRADWGWMTGCKPLMGGQGEILLPLYEENGAAFVLRSEDGGMHWESSKIVENETGVIQPTLALLSDGRLLMYLRTYEPAGGTIWQSVSEDEGRTWSALTRVGLPNPNSRVDLVALASGRMVLAFNDTGSGRTPLTLGLSEDNGETWPYRLDVETEPGEYSYPAIIQASDGLLHLVYTWQRTHIAHVVCDEAYVMAQGRRV